MNALEIRNLCKSYKDFKLDNISFVLPMGCVMGFVGENGAGKSTTIKLIMNLIKRDSGEIYVRGQDNRQNSKLRKEDIGVVLDEGCFPDALPADKINSIMKLTFKNWDEKSFFDYLVKFSLPRNKPFKDFSRGMKMKLSIAVALSHKAKLLILDEATSGLDPIARDEILDIFFNYICDENHAIFISSHIISDLEKLCDYITFIHDGKIVLCEEKDKLIEKYGILKCSKDDFKSINSAAVKGTRQSNFGVEALVERRMIPSNFTVDRAELEDIIVFSARKERV